MGAQRPHHSTTMGPPHAEPCPFPSTTRELRPACPPFSTQPHCTENCTALPTIPKSLTPCYTSTVLQPYLWLSFLREQCADGHFITIYNLQTTLSSRKNNNPSYKRRPRENKQCSRNTLAGNCWSCPLPSLPPPRLTLMPSCPSTFSALGQASPSTLLTRLIPICTPCSPFLRQKHANFPSCVQIPPK